MTATTWADLAIYDSVLNDLIPVARQLLDAERDLSGVVPNLNPSGDRGRLWAVERLAEQSAVRADALPVLMAVALLRLAEQETR